MVAQVDAKHQSWLVVDDQVMVIYVINSVPHLIILFILLFLVFIKTHSDPRGGGMEMLNIGSGQTPKKKIVTSPKLGLFLGRKAQEACPSILL